MAYLISPQLNTYSMRDFGLLYYTALSTTIKTPSVVYISPVEFQRRIECVPLKIISNVLVPQLLSKTL